LRPSSQNCDPLRRIATPFAELRPSSQNCDPLRRIATPFAELRPPSQNCDPLRRIATPFAELRSRMPEDERAPPIFCICSSDGELAPPTRSEFVRWRSCSPEDERVPPIVCAPSRRRARSSDGEPAPAAEALRAPLSGFTFRRSCSSEEPGTRSQLGEARRPRASRFACGRARFRHGFAEAQPGAPGHARMRPFVGGCAASQA
jgi:hypothetical protein